MCLISFIIPLYNKKNYIKRCLDSLCCQKGDDIQIIVIDDGSTDESRDIVLEFRKKDKRIEYFYQNNMGVSSARNKGIEAAKGDWIAFVDADDFINRDYMDIVRPYLTDDTIDCYVIGCSIVKNEKVIREGNIHYLEKEWEVKGASFVCDYFCGNAKGTGPLVTNKIMKTEIIRREGISFLPLKVGEDVRFNLDFIMHSKRWKGIPAILYNYVQNQDSVTHEYREENIRRIHELMESNDEFGKIYGIYEQVKSAIACKNVYDILSIIIIINKMYPKIIKKYKTYKKIMNQDSYRKRIKWVDTKKLKKQHKVVYYMFKYKMALAMVVLMKGYDIIYKL